MPSDMYVTCLTRLSRICLAGPCHTPGGSDGRRCFLCSAASARRGAPPSAGLTKIIKIIYGLRKAIAFILRHEELDPLRVSARIPLVTASELYSSRPRGSHKPQQVATCVLSHRHL